MILPLGLPVIECGRPALPARLPRVLLARDFEFRREFGDQLGGLLDLGLVQHQMLLELVELALGFGVFRLLTLRISR
jgi:hypothetical protein